MIEDGDAGIEDDDTYGSDAWLASELPEYLTELSEVEPPIVHAATDKVLLTPNLSLPPCIATLPLTLTYPSLNPKFSLGWGWV